jgi:hypothetical protein
VEAPTVQESTPAMLRQPTLAPARKPRKYYWLSALSVMIVLGVSALVALMSRSSGARNLPPEPEPPQAQATEVRAPEAPPPEPKPAPATAQPGPAAVEPARPRNARRASREPAPRDPYVDLPPPRRPRVTAPELDQGDPWAADPPR